MIDNPMDVLNLFPIRKNKKQKQAFRDAVQSYVGGLGYESKIEKGSMGAKNVVIGNPETARYLVTAHYDTPAALSFPNLITPQNALAFILYQLFVVLFFVVAAVLPGIIIGVVTKNSELASDFALLIYWVLLVLMLVGPANKTNANDNTSGVVTVLDTAAKLPEELRSSVCFVLFDLEEAGLIGSAAYAKAHKKEIKDQIILNCDCVGDGNEIVMFPTGKLKKDENKMQLLGHMEAVLGDKSLKLHRKGFSVYPSDQKNFPYGVGIAAFRRSKWAGLYCDKIHTKKDTILEEDNVSFLRDRLIELVTRAD